ncbi:MAG: hypothetical protein AAB466_04980 [Verrucomicrobiota bacterium]
MKQTFAEPVNIDEGLDFAAHCHTLQSVAIPSNIGELNGVMLAESNWTLVLYAEGESM